MKQKPRVKYWAIVGVSRGMIYIPKNYISTQLAVYTDRKMAEKECVGAEKVKEVKVIV